MDRLRMTSVIQAMTNFARPVIPTKRTRVEESEDPSTSLGMTMIRCVAHRKLT